MYTPFAHAFAYAIKQTPYAFVAKIILCMYLLYDITILQDGDDVSRCGLKSRSMSDNDMQRHKKKTTIDFKYTKTSGQLPYNGFFHLWNP